jgi:8-oxo-dGTP pyrophosphatase MutT (NUDIX family)
VSQPQNLSPKICFTVSGCLIVDGKVLLVKHRKAGFWLKPGGHIEPGELPHLAAVREFQEETGIQVKIKKWEKGPTQKTAEAEFLPLPFLMNLHWVSHENYEKRITSKNPDQRTTGTVWDRGCEQHLHSSFLLEPAGSSVKHSYDPEESLDIGWFTLDEVNNLETTEDIKSEIKYAFTLLGEK